MYLIEKMKLYREYIISEYQKIYNDYSFIAPMSLENNNDVTLDFNNCTVCYAKDKLARNIIGNNYIMIQPCLRNNNFKMLIDPAQTQKYMSYFTMIGGFNYIKDEKDYLDNFNEIVLRQYMFFRIIYPGHYIKLTIPEDYKKYLVLKDDLLDKLDCEIFFSKDDTNNLKWKYGITGIKGYGTRWEVKDIYGNFVNCGNDIVVFNKKDEAIGIDFGSGLEALMSVYFGNSDLLFTNDVCNEHISSFVGDDTEKSKLINSLTSLMCCDYYKKNKNVRINLLIDNYIRIISAISLLKCISLEQITTLIKEIRDTISMKNYDTDSIILKISTQIEFLNKIVNKSNNYSNTYCYNKYLENGLSKMFPIEKEAIKIKIKN